MHTTNPHLIFHCSAHISKDHTMSWISFPHLASTLPRKFNVAIGWHLLSFFEHQQSRWMKGMFIACYAHWFAPVNRLMPFRSALGLTKKFKEETLSAADFRDPTLSPADIYGRKRVTELPATATRPIFAPKGLATCLINGLMKDVLLCYIVLDGRLWFVVKIYLPLTL